MKRDAEDYIGIGCGFFVVAWFVLLMVSIVIELFSSCSFHGTPTASPTPVVTDTPEPTPSPIPEPTLIPPPTPTPHPDYEKHYISRVELIEGYWNYSEAELQRMLDLYDYGYEDGYYSYIDENGSYDDGYQEGYDEGYDKGYNEGYDCGYEESREDIRDDGLRDERREDRDWLW